MVPKGRLSRKGSTAFVEGFWRKLSAGYRDMDEPER
jgi:hypothetical protein